MASKDGLVLSTVLDPWQYRALWQAGAGEEGGDVEEPRRQREAYLGKFEANLVYIEFQDSQSYMERPCLKGNKWLKSKLRLIRQCSLMMYGDTL